MDYPESKVNPAVDPSLEDEEEEERDALNDSTRSDTDDHVTGRNNYSSNPNPPPVDDEERFEDSSDEAQQPTTHHAAVPDPFDPFTAAAPTAYSPHPPATQHQHHNVLASDDEFFSPGTHTKAKSLDASMGGDGSSSYGASKPLRQEYDPFANSTSPQDDVHDHINTLVEERTRREQQELEEAEEARQEHARLAEATRLEAEVARQEARLAEAARQEQARLAEAAREEEEQEQEQEEQARLAEAARQEQARLAEAARQEEEEQEQEEHARLAEATRQEAEVARQEARLAEAARQQEEQARLAEAARQQEEQARFAEAARQGQEQARLAEAARQEARLAEAARQEQARLAEAARQEAKVARQEARLAEAARQQEEQARLAEAARQGQEQARLAEAARQEARLAEAARQEEEQARLAEAARQQEEQARLAEAARQEAEVARQEARLAEAARQEQEQARLAEAARLDADRRFQLEVERRVQEQLKADEARREKARIAEETERRIAAETEARIQAAIREQLAKKEEERAAEEARQHRLAVEQEEQYRIDAAKAQAALAEAKSTISTGFSGLASRAKAKAAQLPSTEAMSVAARDAQTAATTASAKATTLANEYVDANAMAASAQQELAAATRLAKGSASKIKSKAYDAVASDPATALALAVAANQVNGAIDEASTEARMRIEGAKSTLNTYSTKIKNSATPALTNGAAAAAAALAAGASVVSQHNPLSPRSGSDEEQPQQARKSEKKSRKPVKPPTPSSSEEEDPSFASSSESSSAPGGGGSSDDEDSPAVPPVKPSKQLAASGRRKSAKGLTVVTSPDAKNTADEAAIGLDPLPAKEEYPHNNGLFATPNEVVPNGVVHFAKSGIAPLVAGAEEKVSAPNFKAYETNLAKQRGFPSVEASTLSAAAQRVKVETFPTIRESGRCGAPIGEDVPFNTFAALQTNFFRASQSVVGLAGGAFVAERFPSIPSREPLAPPPSEPNALPFSTFAPVFESGLVKNDEASEDEIEPEHSSDDDISDDDVLAAKKEARQKARTLAKAKAKARRPFALNPIEDPTDPSVVGKIGGSFMFPDPLQMWEGARGKRLKAPESATLLAAAAKGSAPSAKAAASQQQQTQLNLIRSTFSTTHGPNTHRVYSNEMLDINAFRRPLPAVSMFNNGFLLRFDITNLTSALEKEHGPCDPLLFTFALYSIAPQWTKKLSEDFSVGLHLEQFFPHKGLHLYNNLRSFVVYVPAEHRQEPLVLVARAHRLSCDDFHNYVDLYQRPDRYQNKHLIPMKQETQQLAMQSDVMQELGFTFFRVQEAGVLKGDAATSTEKLYRPTKALRIPEIADHVNNEQKLKSFYTVPVTIAIHVSDVTLFETSFPSGLVEAVKKLSAAELATPSAELVTKLSMNLDLDVNPTPQETESLIWLRDPEDVKGKKDLCRHVGCPRHVLGGGYVNAYHNVYYFRVMGMKLAMLPAATKCPSTHKMYCIQVALKDNDDSWSEEGMPAIYGGPMGHGLLNTSSFSTTTHGARDVDFTDEFKIQMPAHLTRKHHIFVTYWAITTKRPVASSGNAGQVPRMIKLGHSILGLMTNEGGALNVKDLFDLPLVTLDTATSMGAGYMEKIGSLPTKDLALNGANVLNGSTAVRSTVYSSNSVLAEVTDKMSLLIPFIVKDDKALTTSNELATKQNFSPNSDGIFQSQLRALSRLDRPEIVAYFPALCSYQIAIISSPSSDVSLAARRHALSTLLYTVDTVHKYDTTSNIAYRRVGTSPKGPIKVASSQPAARTAAANTLYTFLSNNALFTEQRFAVAQGIAEVWHADIVDLAGMSTRTPEQTNQFGRLGEYSWFLLDLILRSLYLSSPIATTPNVLNSPRSPAPASGFTNSKYTAIDPSFYLLLENLLTAVFKKEVPISGTVIVGRVAVFLRQASVRCDRGAIMQVASRVFRGLKAVPANVQCALRVFVEHENAYLFVMPPEEHCPTSSAYFMHTFLELLKPSLTSKSREARVGAAVTIYNFCVRLVNNSKVTGNEVTRIATSMYPLVVFIAQNWKEYSAVTADQPVESKSPAAQNQGAKFSVTDRRVLISVIVWIMFHGGIGCLRGFLQVMGEEDNREGLAGFLHMMVEAQNIFRYKSTPPKNEVKLMDDQLKETDEWDSRFATFVHIIGSLAAVEVLGQCMYSMRRIDQRASSNPQIFPYFLLLEAIVSVNNASVSLLAGSAALHMTSHNLFPELISGRASYMSGMILLALRLMSFATQNARSAAIKTVTEMATLYHTMCGGMSRMRSNMANGLVGVAESKGRDMSRAGTFILEGLQSVSLELKKLEGTKYAGVAPEGFMERFNDGGATASSSSNTQYNYHVPSLPSSEDWVRNKQVADTVLQQQLRATAGTLSEEFGQMVDSLVQLFKSVLRVQQDDAMKFKESKCSAYHQIIASFFNQCVVTQGFKWLQRLHDTHRGNDDHVEAALTSVVSAALAFRITEIFYDVKGRDTKGARMPYAIITHVSYSEYLHIVPELLQILPTPAVYAMVTEMSVVGNEPVFTVEGQIVILQAAAALLDKANYAELSLSVALLAAKFAIAKGDYAAGSASYTTSSKLCSAIASTNVRRAQHRYYMVWARMEMEQAPLKIKKMRSTALGATESMVMDETGDLQAAASLAFNATNTHPNLMASPTPNANIMKKPTFLAEPVRRIFKVPQTVDKSSFQLQALQLLGSLLENPSIITPTEDGADTLPYTKPKKKKGIAAAQPQALKVTSPLRGGVLPQPALVDPNAAPVNRCWLTVREVAPHLTEEEQSHLRPHQRICNAIDKTTFISKFECTSLKGLDKITKVSEGFAGSMKAMKEVSQFDPLDINRENHIFTVERSFPCTTTAIEITVTQTTRLDAAETAVDIIKKETQSLTDASTSGANVNLIIKIHEALTPLGIVPAGHYYKQLALSPAMRKEETVMAALKSFIIIAKKLTDDAIMGPSRAMEKHPDKSANVLKAVADMECSLL